MFSYQSPFNSYFHREEIYVETLLEINNKHANVSLLTLVANNIEQQLPTGVVL